MKTIMLTSTNYIGNSQFKYILRKPLIAPDDIAAVALVGADFYNMSYNIQSAYGNNFITLYFRGYSYMVSFPDGYYSASDINSKIQAFCYLNSLYMTASDGKIVYFVEILENSVLYKIQLNIYAIPTAAQATTLGYTIPSTAVWTLPIIAETPQVSLSSFFGALIGLPFGNYPTVESTTSVSFVSTITPVISPINSYIFACNLINNPYGVLPEHLATVALSNSLGSIVQYNAPAIIPNEIFSGIYVSITITLYDQSYNLLTINDNEFNITLALISPSELKAMLK
jgi:hypothetical protein